MAVATVPHMSRRFWLVLFLVAALLGAPMVSAEPVWPGPPSETVRRHVDEIIAIARDKKFTAAARREAAHRAVARTIDFWELSRRALGDHWSRMTAAERKDVIAGLQAMLTAIYISRIEGPVGARLDSVRARLKFLSETVSGNLANVRMTFTHAGDALPLEVSLLRRGREWRITDLAVDGIRLSENLRAQIAHLSRDADYGEVLERLREREQMAMVLPSASSGRPSQKR